MTDQTKIPEGKLLGWCTRCGGDEINGTRHVCRRPMKDAAEMIATKRENARLRAALRDLLDAYLADVNPNDRNHAAIEHARRNIQ